MGTLLIMILLGVILFMYFKLKDATECLNESEQCLSKVRESFFRASNSYRELNNDYWELEKLYTNSVNDCELHAGNWWKLRNEFNKIIRERDDLKMNNGLLHHQNIELQSSYDKLDDVFLDLQSNFYSLQSRYDDVYAGNVELTESVTDKMEQIKILYTLLAERHNETEELKSVLKERALQVLSFIKTINELETSNKTYYDELMQLKNRFNVADWSN